MHKKIILELNSLAHDILKMNDKTNVFVLKEKASKVYEKISILAYIEEYIATTPQAKETKEELISKFEKSQNVEEINVEVNEIKEINNIKTEIEEVNKNSEENIVIDIEDSEEPAEIVWSVGENEDSTQITEETEKRKNTLEDELEDTVSVDVIADMFSKTEPKSLNDKLNSKIQIDLNDRVVFVKYLFKGDQSEFNRMVTYLNKTETLEEAIEHIKYSVKPEYDWSEDEEYEKRLIEIVTRKFS